jgi:hypothetical protein
MVPPLPQKNRGARNAQKRLAGKKRSQRPAQNNKGKATVKVLPSSYPTVEENLKFDSLSISAPTNRTRVQRSLRPQYKYAPNGDVIINYREFVSDITGDTAAFRVAGTFPINPGLVGMFPWLSRMASNFESYVFLKLKFCYETQASTAQTGSVILAVDYDPKDSAPTGKAQALNYRGTVRSAPWCPCVHVSLPEDFMKRKTYFVRAGAVPSGENTAMYDVGNLFVITNNNASTAIIGEVWVDYEVRLMTPQSLNAGGGNAVWSEYNLGIDRTEMCVLGSGNAPATVVNTAPAASVSTFTFQQAYQGLFTFNIGGTGIGATSLTGTGTVTSFAAQTNAGATGILGKAEISVAQGQTLILSVANTTLTSNSTYLTQGLGAFN